MLKELNLEGYEPIQFNHLKVGSTYLFVCTEGLTGAVKSITIGEVVDHTTWPVKTYSEGWAYIYGESEISASHSWRAYAKI